MLHLYLQHVRNGSGLTCSSLFLCQGWLSRVPFFFSITWDGRLDCPNLSAQGSSPGPPCSACYAQVRSTIVLRFTWVCLCLSSSAQVHSGVVLCQCQGPIPGIGERMDAHDHLGYPTFSHGSCLCSLVSLVFFYFVSCSACVQLNEISIALKKKKQALKFKVFPTLVAYIFYVKELLTIQVWQQHGNVCSYFLELSLAYYPTNHFLFSQFCLGHVIILSTTNNNLPHW